MIWPDSDQDRQAWMTAAFIETGRPYIDRMSKDLVRSYARVASSPAPRLAELQPKAVKRFKHGAIMGRIVLEASMMRDRSRAQLTAVRQRIADDLKPQRNSDGLQIEPSTMINKNGPIYKFRAVGHLWAAYLNQCAVGAVRRAHRPAEHKSANLQTSQIATARLVNVSPRSLPVFPCEAKDLARFLAVAELIRETAENTRAGRSHCWVLNPGEAVRLPAGLAERADFPRLQSEYSHPRIPIRLHAPGLAWRFPSYWVQR